MGIMGVTLKPIAPPSKNIMTILAFVFNAIHIAIMIARDDIGSARIVNL